MACVIGAYLIVMGAIGWWLAGMWSMDGVFLGGVALGVVGGLFGVVRGWWWLGYVVFGVGVVGLMVLGGDYGRWLWIGVSGGGGLVVCLFNLSK